MTLIAASIPADVDDDIEDLRRQAESAVASGARLVEWRLDDLAGAGGGVETAVALLRRCPAPVIATCRHESEGGTFRGDEADRATLYEALISDEQPPRYVDVELSSWRSSPELRRHVTEALETCRRERDVHTSLILSMHDFEGRPRDLLQRIEAMTAEPACDVIKVAWQARSVRDNLEALDLLAERGKPTIALCMGRFGLMSRALAPKFGGLLVYASGEGGLPTAPGQPTIHDLKTLRFDAIGPSTAVYGVVGWPVEHSLSPAIHNAGFESVGHDGVYLPLPVAPGYEPFKATVGALAGHARLDFRGASVTVPHKEHLVRFARESDATIEPMAGHLGAANTLAVSNGRLECINTDAPAALQTITAAMGVAPDDLSGRSAAILGAGGVARAVVGALAETGMSVVVFNRTVSRARELAAALNGLGTIAVGDPARPDDHYDLVVNCTSVGMEGGPAPDRSPLPDGITLDDTVTVFDTVYAPQITPLLEQAREAGAKTAGGLDMFMRQALRQFHLWTGKDVGPEALGRPE